MYAEGSFAMRRIRSASGSTCAPTPPGHGGAPDAGLPLFTALLGSVRTPKFLCGAFALKGLHVRPAGRVRGRAGPGGAADAGLPPNRAFVGSVSMPQVHVWCLVLRVI